MLSGKPSKIKRRNQVARHNRRALAVATAGECIGELWAGCEIFGVNKGQFSLIDITEHCLAETGPADVTISTWTAARSDIDYAFGFLTNGSIRSMRFITDYFFPRCKPEYCEAVLERFGPGSLRLTKTHAKFVMIRNETWDLVVRSSMNLNENRRLETFEISDDAAMADYIEGIVGELWEEYGDREQFGSTPEHEGKDFERLGIAKELAHKGKRSRYFGEGEYDTDLRRRGWSTEKKGRIK